MTGVSMRFGTDPKLYTITSFTPAAGAWGRQGATQVNLKAAKKMKLRAALEMAWEKAAPRATVKEKAEGAKQRAKPGKKK